LAGLDRSLRSRQLLDPFYDGFGTRLIERSLALDLEGDVEIKFAPGGVICTVDAPLEPAEQSSEGSAAGG
jgi:hypothetical protein